MENTIQCTCALKTIVQLLVTIIKTSVVYVCHAGDDRVLGSTQLAALTKRSPDVSTVDVVSLLCIARRLPPVPSHEGFCR